MALITGIIDLPRTVWRARHGDSFAHAPSVGAYLRRLSQSRAFADDAFDQLSQIGVEALLWVALSRIDTPRLGPADQLIALDLDVPAVALATDGAGAYLLLFDFAIEDVDNMSATHTQHNFDRALAPNEPLQGDVEPALLASQAPQAPDDDEDKPVARGAGDDAPAHAALGFNIRPDVVDTPSGTATITTVKNNEFEAYPDATSPSQDQAAQSLETEAERAQATAQEVAPEVIQAVDVNRSPTSEAEAVAQRAAEDDARRQEADMRARQGEAYDAETGVSAREYLLAMLDGAEEAPDASLQEQLHDAGEERGMGGGRVF